MTPMLRHPLSTNTANDPQLPDKMHQASDGEEEGRGGGEGRERGGEGGGGGGGVEQASDASSRLVSPGPRTRT